MFKNVMQVIIWGIWLLIALNVFQVGKSWLLAIFAGLSTGLGFASKDILENIYYGISLMMGRVKVGDYIICDGTRGKVSSISYTSTMLEATQRFGHSLPELAALLEELQEHDQESWL